MNERLKISFIGIALWWMLLLPFDYNLFNWLSHSFQRPVFAILKSMDDTLLFETDTYGTYLLVSFKCYFGITFRFHHPASLYPDETQSADLLKTILSAILFLFLFKYGWDKIVKTQFYLPEPNILYTPFGKLSKDIAYWSLTGSSYAYTVTLGFIEVATALLLLFKRTQFLASLLCVAVFTQIVLVNFSFDISVKVLSCSLLFFSMVYTFCFPENWKGIFGFKNNPSFTKNSRNHQIIKGAFVLLIFLECTLPSFRLGNFNDDQFPRLKHHGAYEVLHSAEIKRVLFTGDGYVILQNKKDEFRDFKLNISKSNSYSAIEFPLTCNWSETKSELILQSDTFQIRKIPYRNLPLLQESFHTFSDEFH